MNAIQRDLIRNTFSAEIKTYGLVFFIIGSIDHSEETKKLICTNYAKNENEEYNDYNFSIQGICYDFTIHFLDVNFILGSVGVTTSMRIV